MAGHGSMHSKEGSETMFVVRNVFVAKPGCASKLAAHFKEVASAMKMPAHRVLTDVTGDFNRVILEYEVESVAEFEKQHREIGEKPEFREKRKGYTDLWVTGSREILRVM